MKDDSPGNMVRELMDERATCELVFELEGRPIARIEMHEGKVRHAEMTGMGAGSAVRVIQWLPSKTRAVVRHLSSSELGPRTLTSGAWERPVLK